MFPLFKIFFDDDAEKAWRTVSVVPAVIAFASGIIIYFISDDAPKGNFGELKKHGSMPEISAAASFRSGAINFNTWILFIQYGCCFGVELTMNNAAALYFKDEFGQSTESAAAIASIFGWMNLFARGLGGFFSDKLNASMGMRGRIIVQTVLLLIEGALVLVFANTSSLGGAIAVMIVFSLFVQAAEGSTYGIVPYVDPASTGSIAGIVGAGGNTGAVGFGLGFRQLTYEKAFVIMGASIMASAILSIFINLKGHRSLLWGKDDVVASKGVLVVPEKDDEAAEEVNA
jgi:NNP family nitrate/nitrite transporter-like MFS transporter